MFNFVPIVTGVPGGGNTSTDNDHRDLVTALKLLSGKDCKRDVQQAQVLLVGLTESRHKDVSEDARAVMNAALARGWLEDKAPHFFELERIASKSLENFRKNPRQKEVILAISAALGVAFLLFGVFIYTRADELSADQVPLIAMALVFLTIVGLLAAKLNMRRR